MKLLRFIFLVYFAFSKKGCSLLETNIKGVGPAKFIEAYKNVVPSSEVRNVWC